MSKAWVFTAVLSTLLVTPAVYYSKSKVEAGVIVFSWLWALICIGLYDLKVRRHE